MERQLKERLIGAAVLVAAAVVMVPEMFSGPSSPVRQESDSSEAAATQLKTYRIELQSSRAAMPTPEAAVAAPAERPQDEVATPEVPADTDNVDTSSAASAIAQQLPQPAPSQALSKASELETTKPIVAKPDSPKSAPIEAKPVSDDWAVQVGSFGTQDKAQQIASKLKQQGYPAFVGSVKVNGKTLYRVRVGAMERAAAESALQKLRASYPGASVVPSNR